MHFENGDVYEGQWGRDKPQGNGCMTWAKYAPFVPDTCCPQCDCAATGAAGIATTGLGKLDLDSASANTSMLTVNCFVLTIIQSKSGTLTAGGQFEGSYPRDKPVTGTMTKCKWFGGTYTGGLNTLSRK